MKKLKKDNRGVSLVMVIAAIALVTVLVTVALTMGTVELSDEGDQPYIKK